MPNGSADWIANRPPTAMLSTPTPSLYALLPSPRRQHGTVVSSPDVSLTTSQLDKYMKLDQKGQIMAEYVWVDAKGETRSKSRVSCSALLLCLVLRSSFPFPRRLPLVRQFSKPGRFLHDYGMGLGRAGWSCLRWQTNVIFVMACWLGQDASRLGPGLRGTPS